MKNKKIICFFGKFSVILFLSICISCEIIPTETVPYIISKPTCYAETKEGYYNFVGVEFEYANISDKIVTKISVSFIVYDADTKQNPFIGTNIINETFGGSRIIKSKEKKLLIISLDPYIYVAPAQPYLIDFFYISSVEFSDGSSWEDHNGIYYTRSY
jgi:hypothetical protein